MDSPDNFRLGIAPVSSSNRFTEPLAGTEREANLTQVRSEVLQLLKEKRYEDALQLLYWARSKLPGHAELQRSVEQVKELLVGSYAKRLGGLDKLAEPLTTKPKRSPDFLLISRYIDGVSTYGDLAQICPLGRLRTLQLLTELYCPDAEAQGEPRSGERVVNSSAASQEAEELEEKAPITRRSSSLPPPAEQSVDRPPGRIGPPPSSRSPDIVPSVGPDGKEYRVSQPGEAHPFATSEPCAFRESFEAGTSAFVQKRFEEAAEAFRKCMNVRPDDKQAEVMLRHCERELASR